MHNIFKASVTASIMMAALAIAGSAAARDGNHYPRRHVENHRRRHRQAEIARRHHGKQWRLARQDRQAVPRPE